MIVTIEHRRCRVRLSALTVGIDRGWISREAGRTRVLTTLEFLWNSPHGPETDATGYKGFYYHFLDLQTGRRDGDSELSTVDTALLLAECCTCSNTSISMTLQKPRSVPWPTTCITASSGRGCKCARRDLPRLDTGDRFSPL